MASCLIEIQARGSYGFQSKKPLWRVQKHFGFQSKKPLWGVQKHFGFQSKKHFGGCFSLYELFFPRSPSSEFFIFCEAHPKTKMCAHSWGGGIIVCYNVPYNYTTTKIMSFFEGVWGGRRGGVGILCRFLLIFGGWISSLWIGNCLVP